eukprot:4203663-Pyramimonas_sp.AAC.1
MASAPCEGRKGADCPACPGGDPGGAVAAGPASAARAGAGAGLGAAGGGGDPRLRAKVSMKWVAIACLSPPCCTAC